MRVLFVILGGSLVAVGCTNDFDALGTDGVGVTMPGSGAASSSASGSVGGANSTASQGSSSGTGGGSGGQGATGATGGTGNPGGAGAGGESGTGGTPVTISCDMQYGSVNGYVPCPADAGQCGFSFSAGGQTSCAEQCGLHGGECIDAIDDLAACRVYGTGEANCLDTHWGAVWCVCSHGCGGGPPCEAGMNCGSGVCS